MADDFRDELPYPLSLKAENPHTYLELTKMREAAEAVHGKEAIERVSEEYRQMRAQLQQRSLDSSRKKNLQKQTLRLEQKYGYEVMAGAPRITRGDHPVHNWGDHRDVGDSS